MSAFSTDKQPTMRTVAAEAGVSVGTVSNFLNSPARLTPSTQARVRTAIERLGYIPNGAARDLKRTRKSGVGLIVPDISSRLFLGIARGAQKVAGRDGQSLLLANAFHQMADGAERVQAQFLEYFAEARMSGIIYAPTDDPTSRVNRIRAHVRPIVLVNYDQPGDWCSVILDHQQAGRLAGEYVAGLGYRHVVFVAPRNPTQASIESKRGLSTTAERLGLELTEVTAAPDFTGGGSVAHQLIRERVPGARVAVVCATDAHALGVLNVLRSRPEVRVPDDIGVVGLDGEHSPRESDWIGLTSVGIPSIRMGEEAFRLMRDEVRPGHRHRRLVLPVRIEPEASTERRRHAVTVRQDLSTVL